MRVYRQAVMVFPTCVGVFLKQSPAVHGHDGLPHMRGGVSHERITYI